MIVRVKDTKYFMVIDSPFPGANPWVAGVGILLGQKVEYNNNIYQATVSGTLAATTPAPA